MHKSKFLLTSIYSIIFFATVCALNVKAQSVNNIIDEENVIKQAVENYYIKGLQTRDYELIREICVREEILMGVRNNGELNVTTHEKWSKRFDPGNPPFQKLDYCISKIDVAGTAAQVKIVFIINEKTRVTDFLNMLKIKNDWKVVNIIDY